MDPELIAFLEARFRETNQQIAGLREETTQQIAGLREETTRQITGLRGEFEGFREETGRNFDRVDGEIRRAGVLTEGLRHEIQIVAEGVKGANERLDAFRAEVGEEFKDVRSLIEASYKDLDRRLRPLEKKSA